MGSTKRSPDNKHYISPDLQEALDAYLLSQQQRLVGDSETLDPASSATRLAHLRGLQEAVDYIYKQLPEEQQHGWDIRRRSAGTQPRRPSEAGGRGAENTDSGKQKRRPSSDRKKGGWFSALNRSRDSGN